MRFKENNCILEINSLHNVIHSLFSFWFYLNFNIFTLFASPAYLFKYELSISIARILSNFSSISDC